MLLFRSQADDLPITNSSALSGSYKILLRQVTLNSYDKTVPQLNYLSFSELSVKEDFKVCIFTCMIELGNIATP